MKNCQFSKYSFLFQPVLFPHPSLCCLEFPIIQPNKNNMTTIVSSIYFLVLLDVISFIAVKYKYKLNQIHQIYILSEKKFILFCQFGKKNVFGRFYCWKTKKIDLDPVSCICLTYYLIHGRERRILSILINVLYFDGKAIIPN